ncbi:MAG: hypothetical protein ACK6BC_10275, partial [Cyanobacteriota bacterium]
ERQVSRLAVGLLVLIILLLLVREGGKLPDFIWKVGLGVVLLNGLGTPGGADGRSAAPGLAGTSPSLGGGGGADPPGGNGLHGEGERVEQPGGSAQWHQ